MALALLYTLKSFLCSLILNVNIAEYTAELLSLTCIHVDFVKQQYLIILSLQ